MKALNGKTLGTHCVLCQCASTEIGLPHIVAAPYNIAHGLQELERLLGHETVHMRTIIIDGLDHAMWVSMMAVSQSQTVYF